MKTEFLYRCFRNESQVISSINCFLFFVKEQKNTLFLFVLSHLMDNFEPDFSHVSLKLILSLKFENFGLVQFSLQIFPTKFLCFVFFGIFFVNLSSSDLSNKIENTGCFKKGTLNAAQNF